MSGLKRWILLATIGTTTVLAVELWARGDEPSAPASNKSTRLARLEARLTADPDNVRLLGRLGVAYFYRARDGKMELVDRAVSLLEKADRLAPDDSWIGHHLGNAYLLQSLARTREPGKASPQREVEIFDRACKTFERILARRPRDADALSSHGLALFGLSAARGQLQKVPEALAEMNRAVEVDPFALTPRLNRAFTLLAFPPPHFQGQTAVEDLSQLLDHVASGENEKARGVLHVLLGDTWLRLENPDKARIEYNEALAASSPARSEARHRLRMLDRGKPDWPRILAYDTIGNRCTACHGAEQATGY